MCLNSVFSYLTGVALQKKKKMLQFSADRIVKQANREHKKLQ